MVCVILSVGDAHKGTLAANRCLSGPLPCLTPYNRKYNVVSASLNKTHPFFLHDLLNVIGFVISVIQSDLFQVTVITAC